jgi:hypothetical protein
MATVAYSTLIPTSDVVEYDNTNVVYPAANIVDTFGTIWVSKVHGYDMNILEIGSAGKLAFTPSNQHSLDLLLDDNNSEPQVVFMGRDSKGVSIKNELSTSEVTVADLGKVTLKSDTTFIEINEGTGVIIDGGLSGSNVFNVASLEQHVFNVGPNEIFRINARNATVSNLIVAGTDFSVPIGPQTSRPTGTNGQVYYNDDTGRFEGFASGAWSGLGGVIDVDQNTFITAETAPGANEDELRFVTGGIERMRIDSTGKLGFGMSNPVYNVDIIGDLRVSGNIIAASTSIGAEGGKIMKLAVSADGSSDIVDGPDTNSGTGIVVAGAPSIAALSSIKVDRFEKSFKWFYGESGMQGLGRSQAWKDESFWKLTGGSFRLGVMNPDSGSEVEFIMRINEKDELQYVKHIIPSDGTAETYDVIASFGKKLDNPVLSASRGDVSVDPDRTSMDVATGTVEAYIEAFAAYDNYKYYCALYPATYTPTTAEVISNAATNGLSTGVIQAATDSLIAHTFTTMYNGTAIPNAIVKLVAVCELISDSSISGPFISYVLNDASIYDTLADQVSGTAATQSIVELEYNFASITWDTLSDVDKAIFRAWMEERLLQGAIEKGINVTSVSMNIVSGSVVVTTGLSIDTRDTKKILNSVYTSGSSTDLLKGMEDVAIEFQDAAPVTVTKAAVSMELNKVERVQTLPTIVSVKETTSTTTTISFEYEVVEANPDYRVTSIKALVSPVSLGSKVTSSTILAASNIQTFSIPQGQTTGTVQVTANPSNTSFVYFVATNNGDPVISSTVKLVVTDALTINTSLSTSSTGGVLLGRQVAGSYAVAIANATTSVYTTADTADAHMLLFESGNALANSTNTQLKQMILDGASNATINLV